MATITPVTTSLLAGRLSKVVWTALTEADTAGALNLLGYRPLAVQVTGTFGGSTVILQGTIDGTNFYGMVDNAGAAVSKAAAGAQSVRDPTYGIRPSASGGTGQSVVVTLLIGKS